MLTPDEQALCKKTRALAAELRDYLAATKMGMPEITNRARTPEEQNAYSRALGSSQDDLQPDYKERFASRVKEAIESFRPYGMDLSEDAKWAVEHPTNMHGLIEVVASLNYLAEKVELHGLIKGS